MTQFLIFISTFLDFWFLPFVIGLGVSIVIEQILRARGNQYDPKAVKKVETATKVRKFLWRQNIILNFSWFLCYFILMFLLKGQSTPMPEMIQGWFIQYSPIGKFLFINFLFFSLAQSKILEFSIPPQAKIKYLDLIFLIALFEIHTAFITFLFSLSRDA